ncbi:hypothetical protein CHS0354_034577 [Potamilus streckersoni]|uniref:Solute carrier family 25 member 45 n=1 Tax=Potamilus streckersoni TaxID=2493646 RepID=A0AAE0SSJ2_9BIVA|nr:hypothetical protein CHS0354_034577 [Potamilus streckersoni]
MGCSDLIVDYVVGAVSGCAGVIFGHPLDTVKVQLQVQQAENKYKGLWDCIKTVHKQGLAKGFFRGLSSPLMSYGIVNSIFFGVYGNVLKLLVGVHVRDEKPNLLNIGVAGAVGGAVQLLVACPAEVMKVMLQSQIPHKTGHKKGQVHKFYKGPIEAFSDIVHCKGLTALYHGLPAQALRDIPASAAYFLIFEYTTYEAKHRWSFLNTQLITFMAGGMAGVLSWTLIMPFDVVKSRVQADSKGEKFQGFLDCAIKSYKAEGFSAFFRGFSVTALRAFLVNASTLLVYVECLKIWKEHNISA